MKNDPPNTSIPADTIERRLGVTALQLCTVEETCQMLHVSRWQVYELINRGQLPSIKIGRRRLVRLSEINAFIDRLHQQGAAA